MWRACAEAHRRADCADTLDTRRGRGLGGQGMTPLLYEAWVRWYRWCLQNDSRLFNRQSMAYVWAMKRARLSAPVWVN